MRFLITGHRGFIGRYLTAELERRGHTWHGLDRSGGGPNLLLRNQFKFCLASAHSQQPIDRVIHLAAQPGRVFGEEKPDETIRLNAQMTAEVAIACRDVAIPLLYTSTSEVYGPEIDYHNFDEGHGGRSMNHEYARCKPINLYGLTKLWGEQVSEMYAPDNLVIVRPTMPYGPGMHVGYGRAALPTFISNAMQGKSITVHRGAMRSWCYVTDMIRAFALVAESGSGIYNVGRDDDLRSMREVAEMACEITGADPALIQEDDADDTVTLVKSLSTQRVYDLGFRPAIDLEEGMRRTYESIKEQAEI